MRPLGVVMIDWAELDRFKFFDEKDTADSPSSRINFNNNSKNIIDREAIDIVRRSRAMSAKKRLMESFLEEFGIWSSGTGPKAGGPHYVARFATEITRTNNITAQGGDPALLNLGA